MDGPSWPRWTHISWNSVLQREMHVYNPWAWPFFEQSLQIQLADFYMIYFWSNQLDPQANSKHPYEMQKIRKARRQTSYKDRGQHQYTHQSEKTRDFPKLPKSGRDACNRFLQSKQLSLVTPWFCSFLSRRVRKLIPVVLIPLTLWWCLWPLMEANIISFDTINEDFVLSDFCCSSSLQMRTEKILTVSLK